MNQLDEAIITHLGGQDPPLTIRDLAARCNSTIHYVRSRITYLLRHNRILLSQCPWRHDYKRSIARHRPSKSLADIETNLEHIVAQDGRDRVAALRILTDIRTQGTTSSGPPPPNNRAAITSSLARILRSAGRDVLNDAILEAWPSDVQTLPETNLAGPPPGGDHLD